MSREDKLWGQEEAFYGNDRKESRKERKIASHKDRSKYKKSDQDQRRKKSRDSVESLVRGRVIAITPEGVVVSLETEKLFCHLRGSLKQETNRMKNLVAVGDFVYIERQDSHPGLITAIEERKSVLSRADNLSRNKEQLIAVNIDQVLITAAIALPSLKPSLIDRYIIAAEKGNMEPIIIINKIDLLEEYPEEKALYEEFIQIYKALHFKVIPLSTKTAEGLEELQAVMQGKTSVFSGQSGVGKSSLINVVTHSSLATGDMVQKTKKGSHTTTTTQLLPLEGGGFCIDTPGIKSFGVWDLDCSEIADHFSEISALRSLCKYHNCSHQNEPDCAVKLAVEKGEISCLRFESYSALIASVGEKHKLR